MVRNEKKKEMSWEEAIHIIRSKSTTFPTKNYMSDEEVKREYWDDLWKIKTK